MADQGRLEGRRGSANSAATIEAAATLIRISYRLQQIARARLAGSELAMTPSVRERCSALEQECCSALESGLGKLESAASSDQSEPAATELTSISDERVMSETSEGPDWSAHLLSVAGPQLESYRRLPILLARLDAALSKFAIS